MSNVLDQVTLKVPNEEVMVELFNSAKSAGLTAYIVHDAGRTQIAAGSKTVLAILGSVSPTLVSCSFCSYGLL